LNICVPYFPLIKKVDHGYLHVDFKSKFPEVAPIATNKPEYRRARNSDHFNVVIPKLVVHETWARSDEEVKFKISNWGHSSDELQSVAKRNSFFKLWQALDEYNYQYFSNFNPASAAGWPALNFVEAADIPDLIAQVRKREFNISALWLFLTNSRIVGAIRIRWERLKK